MKVNNVSFAQIVEQKPEAKSAPEAKSKKSEDDNSNKIVLGLLGLAVVAVTGILIHKSKNATKAAEDAKNGVSKNDSGIKKPADDPKGPLENKKHEGSSTADESLKIGGPKVEVINPKTLGEASQSITELQEIQQRFRANKLEGKDLPPGQYAVHYHINKDLIPAEELFALKADDKLERIALANIIRKDIENLNADDYRFLFPNAIGFLNKNLGQEAKLAKAIAKGARGSYEHMKYDPEKHQESFDVISEKFKKAEQDFQNNGCHTYLHIENLESAIKNVDEGNSDAIKKATDVQRMLDCCTKKFHSTVIYQVKERDGLFSPVAAPHRTGLFLLSKDYDFRVRSLIDIMLNPDESRSPVKLSLSSKDRNPRKLYISTEESEGIIRVIQHIDYIKDMRAYKDIRSIEFKNKKDVTANPPNFIDELCAKDHGKYITIKIDEAKKLLEDSKN